MLRFFWLRVSSMLVSDSMELWCGMVCWFSHKSPSLVRVQGGMTMLMKAAQGGDLALFSQLVALGADIHVVDKVRSGFPVSSPVPRLTFPGLSSRLFLVDFCGWLIVLFLLQLNFFSFLLLLELLLFIRLLLYWLICTKLLNIPLQYPSIPSVSHHHSLVQPH